MEKASGYSCDNDQEVGSQVVTVVWLIRLSLFNLLCHPEGPRLHWALHLIMTLNQRIWRATAGLLGCAALNVCQPHANMSIGTDRKKNSLFHVSTATFCPSSCYPSSPLRLEPITILEVKRNKLEMEKRGEMGCVWIVTLHSSPVTLTYIAIRRVMQIETERSWNTGFFSWL